MTARGSLHARPRCANGGHVKTIFALLMLALSAGAQGQLLKCVSKGGKVEYAQACPEGTTEQKTGIRSAPAGGSPGASSAPAPKTYAERDADFKKRMIEQQEAQQKDAAKAAEAKAKREDCENARSYLQTIESGLRLQRTDPKTGERVYLEDSERASEAARARTRISQACG
jgi:hypothetical protein